MMKQFMPFLKRPSIVGLPLALLMVSMVSPVPCAQSKTSFEAGQDLVDKIHDAEKQIGMGKDEKQKVAALKALAQYIAESRKALPKKDPDADHDARRLRASLDAFQVYLGKIDSAQFASKKCGQYRLEIIQSAHTAEAKSAHLPGEARESLKILSLVCNQPGLAEIPLQKSPPKPASAH